MKPLPTNNPNDTRKLEQAALKFNHSIESSEKRGAAIRAKNKELLLSLGKRELAMKQMQKVSASLKADIKAKKTLVDNVRSGKVNLVQTKLAENPTTRVRDTIEILGLTADMRRDQLNQKRNSNTSSNWVQSLPAVPPPLRRSLWYKMHRRRQQIVLRPTFASMANSMRSEIAAKLNASETAVRNTKARLEEELVRAEQAYLLATHPFEKDDETIPSVPSASVWAEPGTFDAP